MGRFWGGVHVRTTDFSAVHAACVEVAQKLECEFLLAPEIGGWITAYPSNHGQDEAVTQEIATRLTVEVIHVLLHDDDLFCYFFYRNGCLADQYDSNQDYSGRVSTTARSTSWGGPETLGVLLPDSDRMALVELLTGPPSGERFRAAEMLERFAVLLRLPNAATSYEYLIGGETAGIRGWRRFVEVSDPGEDLRRAQVTSDEWSRLRRHGALVLEHNHQPRSACPDGGPGFLAFFARRPGHPGGLSRFAPPWPGGPWQTGLSLPRGTDQLRASRSGRLLVASGRFRGSYGAELWDVAQCRSIARIVHSSRILGMDITRDEKILTTWSSEVVQVVSVLDGAVIRKIPIATPEGAKAAICAVHPSGEMLVRVVRGGVTAMSLLTGEIVKTFYSPHLIDWAEFTGEMRNARKLAPRGEKKDEHVLQTVLEGFHITPAEFWKLSREAMDESATSRPTNRLAFSESGKLLFSSADRALRVYDWDRLLASQECSPEPLHRLDLLPSYATSSGAESRGLILTLTEDSAAHLLLFGTHGGKIGALDLETGVARLLLNTPGAEPIDEMALSRDGAALLVLCRKDRNGRSGRCTVWDYAKLATCPY